jgi:mutator protein MutT
MYTRRTALILLSDESGRVLMQHRARDAPRLSDCWGFFGGRIEEGETPEEAVVREAVEELGIKLEKPELFGRYELPGEDGGTHENFIFVAPMKLSLEELRKRQREGDDMGLFSFDELQGLKLCSNEMVTLKDLFNKGKR